MKESIYTIPISEVFEPKCGCPVCALHETLEARWVEYITGAAMMEPDIRVQTNKHGFCVRHLDMMLGQRNRLSVALILQTRLEYADKHLTDLPVKKNLFQKAAPAAPEEDCFICLKINTEFARIGDNIAALWGRDADFRELYGEQEFLCYPHFRLLSRSGAAALRAEQAKAFVEASAALTRKKLTPCKENIDAFCNLFDYRSADSPKPDDSVSGAIEAAIQYLTGDNRAQ